MKTCFEVFDESVKRAYALFPVMNVVRELQRTIVFTKFLYTDYSRSPSSPLCNDIQKVSWKRNETNPGLACGAGALPQELAVKNMDPGMITSTVKKNMLNYRALLPSTIQFDFQLSSYYWWRNHKSSMKLLYWPVKYFVLSQPVYLSFLATPSVITPTKEELTASSQAVSPGMYSFCEPCAANMNFYLPSVLQWEKFIAAYYT